MAARKAKKATKGLKKPNKLETTTAPTILVPGNSKWSSTTLKRGI